MSAPHDRRYNPTHQWAQPQSERVFLIGVTDFAQQQLGDVMYVELPVVGRELAAGEVCATIESVKTASDVHSPLAGRVLEVNPSLGDDPEQINRQPYQTWLFKLESQDSAHEFGTLLDAEQYQNHLE